MDKLRKGAIFSAVISTLAALVPAQRLAVIAPNASVLDNRAAAAISSSLSKTIRVQDADMSWSAFLAVKPAEPFNMTVEQGRSVGSAVGTDFLLLVDTGTRRRAALDGPDQMECFAVLYLIDSRTGSLIHWTLVSASAATILDAEPALIRRMPQAADELSAHVKVLPEIRTTSTSIESVPEAGSAAAKDFRPPVPYRRLKPEYTRTAYLYDVSATVEATVDLDERGEIKNVAITRWAGFGLDESVISVVRSMNWRPAERNGKPLPVRFLLRYNFKKIDKDDTDNE